MYVIVDSDEDNVYTAWTRTRKSSAIALALKVYKEHMRLSSLSWESKAAKLQEAEESLEGYGSAYCGNWKVSVLTLSKG